MRARHFNLLRAFGPADLVTIGNATAGMSSVLLSVRYAVTSRPGFMWAALALLPLAFVLDALDGYVARKTRRASPYGADLDSLADIVSFGVAPAVAGFALGLSGGWDAVLLVFFVACGISRLARFNVTAEELATATGKVSHFEGTPIPTSLALVAVLAVCLARDATGGAMLGGSWNWGLTLHPLTAMYAVSGSLMVSSTLKIPKP